MSTAFTPPSPLLTAATPQIPSPPQSASSSPIMIFIIIIASAVIIFASIYLFLRVVYKRFRRYFSTADDVVSFNRRVAPTDLLHSLPLFTFRSVTASNLKGGGGDCAVCLSKFEPHDQLRLLPLCCHAFHAACIDKWIASNHTCPLCRSTVFPSASDTLDKILHPQNRPNSNTGSFRIELGSISLRRDEAVEEEAAAGARRAYSLGSYDYTVDDDYIYEVTVASTTPRRAYSDIEESAEEEVSGATRSWLTEYMERVASMSSRTMSFRSSGSFFGGHSRRCEAAVVPVDLAANQAGEEISEIFRWISGI